MENKRYGDFLVEIVKNNPDIQILTSENIGGFYYVREQLKENYLDVGIAEQVMVGIASGMALRNSFPIIHAMGSFLTMRAFEFIRTDIALPNLPVILVGSSTGIQSEFNGPTHQSVEDIGLMSLLPNMNIFVPSDNEEMINGLSKIISEKTPWYIRYNDKSYGNKHSDIIVGECEIFGNRNLDENVDISLISYGIIFIEIYKLKDWLEKSNISFRIINVRFIAPLDKKVLQSVSKSRVSLIVEDHLETGGLFDILSKAIVKKNMNTGNIVPVNFLNYFKPGSISDIEKKSGLCSTLIQEKINELLTEEK